MIYATRNAPEAFLHGQTDSTNWTERFSSPEESGSEQDFGATGVFQAVNIPEAVVEPLPGFGADPDVQGNRAPGGVTQQPMLGAKDLAEPVVHRVGLGGAAAMNSPELLDRIRMASAETSLNLEKAPAAGSGGKGSGGFTELLRTLEDDLPTPVVASKGSRGGDAACG